MKKTTKFGLIVGGIVLIATLFIWMLCTETVPAGHVKVATLFGEVQDKTYSEGLHIVNPMLNFVPFDVRQKTYKPETAVGVPSQDQLTTLVDISIQYRVTRAMASTILRETGTVEQTVEVHLIPKMRSLVREAGKSVKRAEDFFSEKVQQQLQESIHTGLQAYCESKGLEIQAVLIRDVQLPQFINMAIQKKKQREQQAEEQKAELARFKTEQEQKIAQASVERKAAEEEAQKIRVLADARSYEITKINEAVAGNPAYIQLQALKALEAISDSPSTQIYFLNGDSPNPLPLMHMGVMAPNGHAKK